MKNHFFPVLLLTAAALASCETNIAVPTPSHEPRASVLYLLRNEPTGDTLNNRTEGWLYAGASQQIFSRQGELGRADAIIRIADQAGRPVETFQAVTAANSSFFNGPGYYRPRRSQLVQPGQTYSLQATVPGLPEVASTLTMPFPAVIVNASLAPRPQLPGSGTSSLVPARLSVTIQDNAATTDYYLATARLVDAQGRHGAWRPVDLDITSRENTIEVGRFQLSRSFADDFDISPYADTNVNGQQFTFTSNVVYNKEFCAGPAGAPCPTPAFMEVTVSTLTPDAYRFLLAKRRYLDTNGNPFAEPAPLFSNIANGFGVFGGATEVTYRIPLP
ncbi:DUF4249 family protein [Hymenobacter arizonensis]|uniref:DUF4249 domain-containing protein n=1 Tax=Hymenobacter arizonensis TaxID=1227077 RepID=A0A1I5UG45_HYMAR|nr:DUF4249 family protein [Hymenobacter arizonensis]SFP94254.1 protein of unknown function [Hymenobacter arizonensis]